MAHLSLDEERVRELVIKEGRRIMLIWSAVEPIVGIITQQWYMYGHFNYFYVNVGRTRLLKDPMALTTKCLFECLNTIKKNPRSYLIIPAGDVDESPEFVEVQHEIESSNEVP
jgi:hypothetical protein